MKIVLYVIACLFAWTSIEARYPEIYPKDVKSKLTDIMHAHATYKQFDAELVKRSLASYLELLDPTKTYFLESDIQQWTDPSETLTQQVLDDLQKGNYRIFDKITEVMQKAILRRRVWEKELANQTLPTKVSPDQFKDIPWATSPAILKERLLKIRSLQKEAIEKLEPELRATSFQRIAKRQAYLEDEILSKNPSQRRNFVLTNVLKAIASSMDAHTSYFTPDEASQFMISVQQRLFGIGAQLRDDINGFSVTKIVDGGPAAKSGLLKLKDKIIAVNGVPVVGMDITEAVELIRGPENTPVVLTVLREVPKEDKESLAPKKTNPFKLLSSMPLKEFELKTDTHKEQKMDLTLQRGEVVITEARFETSFEPFGKGVIGYLRLHSFYQDPKHSSADDLMNEIETLKKNHHLLGVILDLRGNTGGLLVQAVAVTGLFITKGIVVSIKDDQGKVQHLRDLDGKAVWNGPLIVLIDRGSASASEIVAQALKDYGRAIIVGDDHSYGKGSFQTFTLNTAKGARVDSKGEYTVTRGRYYTVSGQTPQLVGVQSDIVVPGMFSEIDVGEKFLKHPLENDKIPASYDDDMLDIPALQREALKALYHFDLQKKMDVYTTLIPILKSNSTTRVGNNKRYQDFLEQLKKQPHELEEETPDKPEKKEDLQLNEAYAIMRDLIFLMPSRIGN